MATYIADSKRYDRMVYNRCGRSGLKLPAISLGLWHNFGGVDSLENMRAILRRSTLRCFHRGKRCSMSCTATARRR